MYDIDEECEKCGARMDIIIESGTPVQYRANCPICHTNFSVVLLPRETLHKSQPCTLLG
jgi:hypothetical protein